MSYTRVYNEYVTYSGSKTISYPASEHGGSTSVSYSGSIPVNIYLNVDTTPFDYSVGACNDQLNFLTTSVAATNAAQVSEINKGSEAVAEHVIGGFFSLIRSDLSQNMAAALSKIQGTMGLIAHNTQMIQDQHRIMQTDYNRVKAHYVKVFDDLDEECRRRIADLDRKAFDLAEKVKETQLSKEVTEAAVKYLIPMSEGTVVNQQLSIACLKSKVVQIIEHLKENITQEIIYSDKVKAMVHNATCDEKVNQCVPAVFIEKEDLEQADLVHSECYVSDVNGKEQVQNEVKNYFAMKEASIDELNENEKNAISKSFNSLAENALAEAEANGTKDAKRIFDMIMSLKEKNFGADNI